MWKKVLVLSLATLSIGGLLVQHVQGKGYPTKPIEIVCMLPPGSSMDMVSRLVADVAKKYLGQPIVVVNKPGAGGTLAAADVISSKPEGYKLIILTNLYFATTVKTQQIPFEPSHLVPIANVVEFKLGMIVKDDSQWKTLGDLLDYARENPGKLRWSHHGRGIVLHLIPLLIFKKAGVETIDVPFKGGAEQLSALLGGHVDMSSSAYGPIIDHVKSGKVRCLFFYSDRRYSESPNVPCLVDLGFPEAAKLATFVGVYVHKDTPEEIKKTLFNALKKTYEDPEFKQGIERIGEVPKFGGPEFIKEAIKKGEEVGVPVIKELGLYVGRK